MGNYRPRLQAGFTMVELLAVAAIMLVVLSLAMPTLLTTVGNIRARSSAESFAGILQKARAQAAKDNRFYSVIPDTTIGPDLGKACVDLNWNGVCNSGEWDVELARGASLVTSGGPSTTLLTCGPTLGPATCPAGYKGLNYTPEPSTVFPSFNARALPCVGNPPSTEPVWPAVLCYTTDQSQSGKPMVGFLYVFRYDGLITPSYSAITVTPAGRISAWTYSGKDSNGNDVWNP